MLRRDKVRNRLQKFRGRWHSVADQAGMSASWVRQFARGDLNNPLSSSLDKLEIAMDVMDEGQTAKVVPRTKRESKGGHEKRKAQLRA